MSQEYQAYKENLVKINEILRYEDDMRKTFSDDGLKSIKQVLNIMTGQMEKVYKNEPVEPSAEEESLIRKVLGLFINIAIERPITPIFRDFSSNYLLLTFNWNRSLKKRMDIEKDIKLVDMMVKGQTTMLDTIRVLQKLLAKLKVIEQYEPPAFNLNKAYLSTLKKDGERQETKKENKRSNQPDSDKSKLKREKK
jgi:hypothetical protein